MRTRICRVVGGRKEGRSEGEGRGCSARSDGGRVSFIKLLFSNILL